jgi:hypothetical protein
MKIPDLPEYDYSARDPVIARMQVPRVRVTVNGMEMAGSEFPRGSVGSGPVEAWGGASGRAESRMEAGTTKGSSGHRGDGDATSCSEGTTSTYGGALGGSMTDSSL